MTPRVMNRLGKHQFSSGISVNKDTSLLPVLSLDSVLVEVVYSSASFDSLYVRREAESLVVGRKRKLTKYALV